MHLSDRLQDYITARTSPPPPPLGRLERDVQLRLLYPRMCSGAYQGRLLKMLTAMAAPSRVLEVGTFAGYSALCMAEALPDGAEVHTVEIDCEMEPFIRRQLDLNPHGRKVRLHMGDIADIAPSLLSLPPFDMAFIDGNKRSYLECFNTVRPLVRPGGFIIADNTLWSGKVVELPSNPDPQTAGIARFNDAVVADPSLEVVMLPVRDGLTIIRLLP